MTEEDIAYGYGHAQIQTRSGSTDFDDYAEMYFEEAGWEDATDRHEALEQYFVLRDVAAD